MKILAPILLFVFLAAPSGQKDSEWKLKKDADGIKVYYRKSEDSRINELKLTTTVESSLSALVSLLRDVPNYTTWIYKCVVSEPLGNSSPQEGRYYTQLDFPWPLSDRDFVAQSVLSQDPETKIVEIHSTGLPDQLEEKKGAVRIKTLKLYWKFTPLPKGKVQIDYELLSDPGGMLPKWLINMALDQGPTKTILALRQEIQKEKYQNNQLDYIKELGKN